MGKAGYRPERNILGTIFDPGYLVLSRAYQLCQRALCQTGPFPGLHQIRG
jgi:hypothetical protein